jgi:hypothetical protein
MPALTLTEDDTLLDDVLDYFGHLAGLFTKGATHVDTYRLQATEFNAAVESVDGLAYEIFIFDGIARELLAALERIEALTIDDEARAIALALLGTDAEPVVVYRIWLIQSIIFVALHELGHVLRGHFGYRFATRESNASGRFSLQEIPPTDSSKPLSPKDQRVQWLMELEADEFALERMLALAYEIFEHCTQPEASDDSTAHDVDAPSRRKAEELSFYAACLAMAMLQAHRQQGPDHPPPITRLYSLVNVFSRRLIDPGCGPPGLKVVPLDSNTRARMLEAVPVLVNAVDVVDVVDSFCAVASTFQSTSTDSTSRQTATTQMLDDLSHLMTGKSLEQLSPDGVSYAELRVLFSDFSLSMAPHRV